MYSIMDSKVRRSKSKKLAASDSARRRYYASRRPYVSGRGAYYVKGNIGAKAKLPYLGHANIGLEGGYRSQDYVSGKGAYQISQIRKNSLIPMGDPPMVKNAKLPEGATVIRHREYIGQIVSSSSANTFKIDTYPLNPAQSSTFPWLSAVAAQYEEYQPNGVMFEFKSTCSDAIASSTDLSLGQLMMATQYDPIDAPFADEISMLNYEFAQSCKVSESACHFIECDYRQSPIVRLYTRPGAATDSADLRFSDFGNFSIASSGLQGTNVVIGQLWVTYEFLLFKPKLNDIGDTPGAIYRFVNTVVTTGAPLGNVLANQVDEFSTFQLTNTGTTITLPKTPENQSYWIHIQHTTNLASVVYNAYAPTITNGYLMKQWDNDIAAYAPAPSGGATTGAVSMTAIVSVNANTVPVFSISASTTAYTPAGTYVDVTVILIPWLDPAIYPH